MNAVPNTEYQDDRYHRKTIKSFYPYPTHAHAPTDVLVQDQVGSAAMVKLQEKVISVLSLAELKCVMDVPCNFRTEYGCKSSHTLKYLVLRQQNEDQMESELLKNR